MCFQMMQNELQHREPDLRLLLEKGQKVLTDSSLSPMSDTSELSDTINSIQTEQRKLKDKLKNRSSKVKQAASHAEKFQTDLDIMEKWLGHQEERLQSQEAVSSDPEQMAKQVKDAHSLHIEMLKKSRDHENLNSEGEKLMKLTDTDKDVIDRKVREVNDRWGALSSQVSDRVTHLEDVQQRLQDYTDTMTEVKTTMDSLEDKLKAHHSLGSHKNHDKHADKITMLQDQLVSLQPQLEDLNIVVQSVGSELTAGSLQADVDGVNNRYQTLTDATTDCLAQIQTASQNVEELQAVLRSACNELSEADDELQHKGAVGRDVDTVNTQIDDTKVIYTYIVSFISFIFKAIYNNFIIQFR